MKWLAWIGLATGAAASCSPSEKPHDAIANGQALYASMCVSCHGAKGEGGSGPSLRDLDQKYDQKSLAAFIDAKMPLDDPKKCTGGCADDIAAYILATFKGPIVCQNPPLLARGVRLLTRREYKNTLVDLLGASMGAPCGTTAFTFDPGSRVLKTVHVAGSFNNWPATIAAGGWPLAKQNTVWTLTKQVPPGMQQYKFVLDESEWIADPKNPNTAPDGFGGVNSVLDISCSGQPSSPLDDVIKSFPPDTRPQGFLFDDSGAGRVVVGDVGDAYVRAALALAQAADLTRFGDARAMLSKVFRRPPTDGEIARYSKLDPRTALAAALASPGFLYRTEIGERQADGTYRLTQWEIASALSYGLWATMPDGALLDAASKNALATPQQIEMQVRRMLADPRARDTIGTFAEQWLGAEMVTTVVKQSTDLDDALRASMLDETRKLVESVVFDGSHKMGELYTANYTFVDSKLATFYGLGGTGKVTYPDGTRAGILGHASVLATTAHSDQTSPILRGLFVRRRLLCQEFPPPPPNAGGIPMVDPNATTKERFAQHTANPFCHSCHQYIDPVGFGFERFDPIGRVRDQEAGKPIDSQGDMNDVEGLGKGTHAPFASMADLGQTLASSDAAKSCVVKQYWRFVRGRLEDDVCSVQGIAQHFAQTGGDLQEMIVSVLTAPDFVVRK